MGRATKKPFISLPHQNDDQWSKPGLIILVGGSYNSWVSKYKKFGIKNERKHAPTRMNIRSWHCYILFVPFKINKFNIELYQPTIHSLSLLDSCESTRISMESISPTLSRWGVFTRAGRDAFWWGNPEHRRCHESLGEMDLENPGWSISATRYFSGFALDATAQDEGCNQTNWRLIETKLGTFPFP